MGGLIELLLFPLAMILIAFVEHPLLSALATLLVFSALWRAFGARWAPEPRHKRERPPADDPRWSSESVPQIVGKSCPQCAVRFIAEREALCCESCGEAVHYDCELEHRWHSHHQSDGVYR